MKTAAPLFLCFILSVALAACGAETASSTAGDGESFVAEEFCEVENLTASLRHTFILIDSNVIAHTENAEQFVAANAWIRDAVLSIADPDRAINSGASEPRERITIIRLPENGSAGARVFTGCIPAMTPDELSAASARGSRLGAFFAGGVREELEEQAGRFRTRLVAALQAASRAANGPGRAPRTPIAQSSMFAALSGSAGLLDTGRSVPRLVFITNLSRSQLPPAPTPADARREGFASGQAVGLNLRGGDIVLLQQRAGNSLQRSFLDAFFLAQQGLLVFDGEGNVAGLPPAPRTVRRFVGQAAYPDGPVNIQIRIGIDRNGRLASSWITLREEHARSVPMAGQANCDNDGLCALRSTNDAFGQAWSLTPGSEPEFDNALPFGGMRNFELQIDGETISGRVFDPLVSQVGPSPARNSIQIQSAERPDSDF